MDATFTHYDIELEKENINQDKNNKDTFTTADHCFIQSATAPTVQKVTFKELYWFLIATIECKLTSQSHCENFIDLNLDWKNI